MTFNCDPATVQRIVKAKEMTLSQEMDIGLVFGEEFPWWDKHVIERIRPYKAGKSHKYSTYLWYDSSNNTAYYEEFSL
jgi:hypothetical protein